MSNDYQPTTSWPHADLLFLLSVFHDVGSLIREPQGMTCFLFPLIKPYSNMVSMQMGKWSEHSWIWAMQYSSSIDWTTLVAYPPDIVVDGSVGFICCENKGVNAAGLYSCLWKSWMIHLRMEVAILFKAMIRKHDKVVVTLTCLDWMWGGEDFTDHSFASCT